MRNASIAILREIGVDTGGSNVQFAINPQDGRMIVIEMNPRVSRSSALASKATGFPIAKVASCAAWTRSCGTWCPSRTTPCSGLTGHACSSGLRATNVWRMPRCQPEAVRWATSVKPARVSRCAKRSTESKSVTLRHR